MKINIDVLLANMPKDEDELKTVQEKHRKILTDNREKEKSLSYTSTMLESRQVGHVFKRSQKLDTYVQCTDFNISK